MTTNLLTSEVSNHQTRIEWDLISKIIAQFAHFHFNKAELTSTLFTNRTSELAAELEKVEQYLRGVNDEHYPVLNQLLSKLPADHSLLKHISHLSKDGALSFIELNHVVLLVEICFQLQSDFDSIKTSHLDMIRAIDFSLILKDLVRKFRYLVDETGAVDYDKHPELAEAKSKLHSLEEDIRRSIHSWLNDPDNQKILQFNSYDIHFDRYVVPIRSDSYRSEIGLIVSRSESGQTLYVELYQVREACNKRLSLIAYIDQIINQLSLMFSRSAQNFSSLLTNLFHLVKEIDFYLAKAKVCTRFGLERPHIRTKPGFAFSELFHPLIDRPIKNDVVCNETIRGIVISGPNTGGKTVFLKSIAISYLFFFHGFYVPAASAEMYPYEGLFYFGNDLQDLTSGLSSFSGEVKNYIGLMDNLSKTNLILIDEIFNSTSSDEASALSLSIFDTLHQISFCHIIVSTHHQMFKTLIHQDHLYRSCHVGFDTKTLKPTYKIQWGTPGPSMAVDIFSLLSGDNPLLQDVPKRAKSYLDNKNISYETLLAKVSARQIELDKKIDAIDQLERDLKNQKNAMAGILNLKMNDEIHKARKEIEKIIHEAHQIVEEAKNNQISKHRKIDDRSSTLLSKLTGLHGEKVESENVAPTGDVDIHNLKDGDIVYSHLFKKDFKVQAVDNRKLEVTISKGPLTLKVPASTLSTSREKRNTASVHVSVKKESSTHLELDCRGMRLSEFQNLIDNALGDLLSGDIPYLNIIHGHGDGVLKNWLRSYLKKSTEFVSGAPENGNDGETRITLKNI